MENNLVLVYVFVLMFNLWISLSKENCEDMGVSCSLGFHSKFCHFKFLLLHFLFFSPHCFPHIHVTPSR